MKPLTLASAVALMVSVGTAVAQVTSGASNAVATDVPHTTIPYRIEDVGTKLPDIVWGLDLAWISEGNLRRGVNYAGQDLISVVRLSFQPSDAVGDGALSENQKKALDERIRIAKYARFATINLNSDPQDGKAVNSWYRTNSASTNGSRWAQLIGLTRQYVESKGLRVSSISPFNEPDYSGWNQGSKDDFRAICKAIRDDNQFRGILLCGGNTLNPDYALEWYNHSKEYLDEGNTHQLAGTFDNFANFYKQVVADGKVAVGDELHNTMECMVGSEYGLTKGIWWGTCDHTRSQFMKASRGTRMGYAENRQRWVAASVYRHPDSYQEGCRVQGFVGTSERQAAASTFRFVALDHDVFYNGYGPTREYIIRTPGTPNPGGYDTEGTYCRNAEAVVNIQGDDDIMPPLPTKATTFRIVNSFSGRALAPSGNNASSGTEMVQIAIAKTNLAQQWVITPDHYDVGGDFTYFTLANAKDNTLYPDVTNWSLDDQGGIILFKGGLGDNEKWFFEYAGDGSFYIRSKHSALYLQTDPLVDGRKASDTQLKVSGRRVNQGTFTGEAYQKWKLIPADVTYDSKAPAAPTALAATAQPASIRLDWAAPTDRDIQEYVVLRSTDQVSWNTIHNHVPSTAYIDNTVAPGTTYYYKVQTVDTSLNRSAACDAVSASATGEAACIMRVVGDSLLDAGINGNHAALHGTLSQLAGKVGKAINMQPTNNNFLQLPATIAGSEELTLSVWLYYRGGNNRWQRIFDFGTDTDHYIFLTPSNGNNGKMRLAFKNGGSEQYVEAASLATNKWVHVAVVFATDAVTLYVDGKVVAKTGSTIKTRPSTLRPVFNYVGRSQFDADPFFNGAVNDLRIYNYALSADEVAAVMDFTDGIQAVAASGHPSDTERLNGRWYDLSGREVRQSGLHKGIYIINGRKVMIQ